MGQNRAMLFGILGAVEAYGPDGAARSVGGPRVRALLALLLLHPGRIVATETLVDGLYGEDPPHGTANALQAQVSRLRRALRGTAEVEFHASGYRLAVTAEDIDAHRFDRLARDGRAVLAAGDPAGATRVLDEALALWRGPALADVLDAPFAPAQASAWAEQRLDALADRAEARIVLGQHADAVRALGPLVAEHPLRERLVGQLMRALYGAGRQADALAAYENTRARLADELGADPSAELAAVHLDILRAAPALAEAAPDPAPVAAHRNLPAQLTSFVGRDLELDRVAVLLAEARLVTLTGPGGTGKTRLSVETGRREPGEVCFVDLAAVRRADELVQTTLAALGLRETGINLVPGPADDATARLVSGLATRKVLLILDNCEQVVAEVARLAHTVLSACPDVRILATSREALGITGETVCPVPRLAAPDEHTPLAYAVDAPAIRLFADRAVAVRPDFAVDAANLPTIRRICADLDGLPLAIELAAARLRALPLDEIAARLDDRFRLLSRGNRSAAPRHQTLRAVVEWSWGLLDEEEQELARRLTVFAGGATIEAAARVCAIPEGDVVELLADLADKSLVDSVDGRYRMSETIRMYGAERLDEAGERQRLQRAHAEYFLGLADVAEPLLRTREQLVWLDRLSAEHANLRVAVRWAIGADPELGLRLNAALSWYWWLRGVRHEASGPARELLAAVGPEAPPGLAEEYLLCLLTSLGETAAPDDDTRDERVARAQPLLFALPGRVKRSHLFVAMAMALGPYGDDRDRIIELMSRDPWSQAVTFIGDGFVHLYGGEVAASKATFDEALTRFRVIGDRWGLANSLDQLAVFHDWSGDLAGALAMTDEALDLMRQLGITEDIDDLLVRRADMSVRMGDLATACSTYESVTVSARRVGRLATAAVAHAGLGDLARYAGRPEEARRLQERALAECPPDSFDLTGSTAWIQKSLAWTLLALGETSEARSLAYAALDLTLTPQNLIVAAEAVAALAGASMRDGDARTAAETLGMAAATRGSEVPGHRDVAVVAEWAREHLGESVYEEAYATGRALTREAVVARLAPGRAATPPAPSSRPAGL